MKEFELQEETDWKGEDHEDTNTRGEEDEGKEGYVCFLCKEI